MNLRGSLYADKKTYCNSHKPIDASVDGSQSIIIVQFAAFIDYSYYCQ